MDPLTSTAPHIPTQYIHTCHLHSLSHFLHFLFHGTKKSIISFDWKIQSNVISSQKSSCVQIFNKNKEKKQLFNHHIFLQWIFYSTYFLTLPYPCFSYVCSKKQIKNIHIHCKNFNTRLMIKFECYSVIISPLLPCSLQMNNMHNVALCGLK